MAERSNRRDLIIETAGMLFRDKGYTATSVRQIADKVGCTEAALYYHFKEGKRELFHSVIKKHQPDFMAGLEACKGATTLAELIVQMGIGMRQINLQKGNPMQWLIAEFNHFSPEEQALLQDNFMHFHKEFSNHIEPFVKNRQEAEQLGWILICTLRGYAELFFHLKLPAVETFQPPDFLQKVAHDFAHIAQIPE